MQFSRDLPLFKRLLYTVADPFLYVPAPSLEAPPRPFVAEYTPEAANLRVSIVTPSLNQGEFLARTITSVVNQRHPALEYIVQDGGSTDGSVSILRRHDRDLTYWESQPDGGQSAAINAGFRRATGEIMMYLNSDDVLLPGALASITNYFAAHPDIDAVYSHSVMIDRDDRPAVIILLPGHSDGPLRWYDFVPQPTLAWRRSVWEAAGAHIDESLDYAMDWDLLHRFLDAGARFERLPTFLAGFRLHEAQKTQQLRHVGAREVAALRRRHAKRNVSFVEVALRSAPHMLRRATLTSAYRLGIHGVDVPYVLYPQGAAASA